jgi:hypothetical protein
MHSAFFLMQMRSAGKKLALDKDIASEYNGNGFLLIDHSLLAKAKMVRIMELNLRDK